MSKNAIRWIFTFMMVYIITLAFVWESIVVPQTWDLDMLFPTMRLIFVITVVMFGARHIADIISEDV
jgi:hypothetical protein